MDNKRLTKKLQFMFEALTRLQYSLKLLCSMENYLFDTQEWTAGVHLYIIRTNIIILRISSGLMWFTDDGDGIFVGYY